MSNTNLSVNSAALLISAQIFSAQNNIRTKQADVVANIPATDGQILQQRFNLLPAQTKALNVLNLSKGTIIKTSKPLTMALTNMQNVTIQLQLDSLFVVTSPLASLVLTNPSTTETASVLFAQC